MNEMTALSRDRDRVESRLFALQEMNEMNELQCVIAIGSREESKREGEGGELIHSRP